MTAQTNRQGWLYTDDLAKWDEDGFIFFVDRKKEEIKNFCEKNLSRYKCPRSIIFDTVPRSAAGKIEKPKLRGKYC